MFIKKNLNNIVPYIIICLIALLFISILSTKAQSKIFKIKDIEISEPFNVDFNKETVINKAFSKAFDELILTIVTTNDKMKVNNIKLNEIKYLVESFEIKDENFLDEKYVANLNVSFNKKNTLRFFEKKNIFPSLKKKKDFLTILIFIDNDKDQIFLYENNIFYKNWNKYKEKYFLINYILINEDIEDLRVINEYKDNIENLQFNEIIKKYDLNDYIVSIFFKNQNELRILSKFFFDNNLKIINQTYNEVNFDDQSKLDDLIIKTKIELEDLWKSNNLINTSIKLAINLELNPKKTLDIINLEKEMNKIDLVYDYYITSISNEKLNYKIIFNGSPKQFLKIMREKNIVIDIDNELWKIK